eukprot:Gregarina_sp_Poly_1__7630@NODE_428_length_8567_cov_88_085529_g349_i0_p3_GENE_NODE_428_length_8567_cov_88_085529_g349_i0NODE_428_length_8567_cov_88_085529_g349_i0_p3_ORF_typecomplete_len444_score20_89Lung_7TM_R/PF06814_13/6_2e03Lung_7TM_R/PF06814_13/4e17GpcrRhopsn4/PF10192_9/5_7e03GpcrRhopsn4/PF10192_9/2_2e12_NODE_428_length_8567_cov_88_085529_g349_i013772708
MMRWLYFVFSVPVLCTYIQYSNTTLKEDFIIPLIEIPRILEDPQTVPIFNQRFFIFEDRGSLCFNLYVFDNVRNVWLMGFTETQWNQIKNTRIPYLLRTGGKGIVAHPNLPSIFRLELKERVNHCLNSTSLFKGAKYQRFYLLVINPEKQKVRLHGNIILQNNGLRRNIHSSLTLVTEEKVSLIGFLAFTVLSVTYLPLAYLLDSNSAESITAIHYLLTILTSLKAIYLGINFIGYRMYALTGELEYILRIIPMFLSRMEDVGMLLILLLLSLGWNVYRNSLSLVEWRFYTGVSLLSAYLALFEISIGGFQVSRYILAAVVYLCIMVAINFNITLLTNSLMELPISLRAGKTYRRRTAYIQFREIFVVYIIKPSALLIFSLSVLGEEDALGLYILPAFDICVDFLCLAGLMYVFRPIGSTTLMQHMTATQLASPIDITSAVST